MEVLENAAKSHNPDGGGQIIPYADLEWRSAADADEMM